ncbi:3-oxoacyl-acyl-carrier-protein reductase [Aphelenchoides avenae]|nr:3-oxoacyl-acyl-carrier-protein reductase [Aphelenchus avenae]
MQRFQGKVVIITGSSAGIGRQAAIDFSKEGAAVTIHGQSEERIQETKKALLDSGIPESKVLVVVGAIQEEATQKALMEKTVEKFGRIDILINNAGIMKPPGCDMEKALSMECYDYVFAVNVRSVVQLCELVVPHLEKTKGNIINVSSIAAKLATKMWPFYSMSKAALDHWSMDAAVRYAEKGVRVNTVSPGPIRTEFLTRHGITGNAYDELEEKFAQTTLLKRFGKPDEVSAMMKSIASDEASYVTGATLVVDGGRLVNPP